jgi:hypothetical protein
MGTNQSSVDDHNIEENPIKKRKYECSKFNACNTDKFYKKLISIDKNKSKKKKTKKRKK